VKKLTPRTLALLAAAVIGVVALAGWFGVVSPQRSKAESLDAKIADQKSKLTVAQLLARSQQSAKPKANGTKVLLKAMPASLQMPSVLRQVRKLASSSSVTVESFTPSVATPAAGYDAVPIDVSVTGRYASVERFLHKLRLQAGASGGRVHATGRLFDVQKVDLTPGGDGAPELTASIRLATFVYTGTPLAAADAATTTDTATEETA
jgi:Tfp pilus assembly protein PilO